VQNACEAAPTEGVRVFRSRDFRRHQRIAIDVGIDRDLLRF
jgi:hypothetical protein